MNARTFSSVSGQILPPRRNLSTSRRLFTASQPSRYSGMPLSSRNWSISVRRRSDIPELIVRHSVPVKGRYNVPRKVPERVSLPAMREGWHSRLIEAIERDSRGYFGLSQAAGLSRNYVQQLVKYGKEPGAAKLVRILEALGTDASLYIILGVEMTPENAKALAAFSAMTKPQRDALLPFLERVTAQEIPEPPPASEPGASAKHRTASKKR
jgi:transcriptional regulator with XRE-family HTH domain